MNPIKRVLVDLDHLFDLVVIWLKGSVLNALLLT